MNKMIGLFAKLLACVGIMSIGLVLNAPLNYLAIFAGVAVGTHVVNNAKNYPRS